MKKTMLKRMLCAVLALCTVIALIPMDALAAGANDIVRIAVGEVGNSGRPNKYTRWCGSINGSYSYAWCATFVGWCASQAGESTAVPKTASVENMYNGILAAGGSVVSSPQAGDIVVYRRRNDNYYAHVGIMENGSASIEGNYGNAVRQGIWPGNYSYAGSSVSNGKIELVYLRPNYKGSNGGASLRVESYFDCDIQVNTTNGQRVNLYTNPTDTSPKTYFSKGQTAYSKKGANLSDGSVWYQVQASHQGQAISVWLNAGNSGVTVTDLNPDTYSMNPSTTSINLSPGEKQTITIQYDWTKTAPYRIDFKFNREGVAIADWGAQPEKRVQLVVTAQNSGTATLDIWLSDANGKELCKRSVAVNVGPDAQIKKTPLDLGNEFYAYILNTGLGMYATNDPNGNVSSRDQYSTSSPNIWRQIWHFQRLSNGSYKISAPYNNYCLDVQEFGKSSGTNVRAYLDNSCSAQQWYIYSANGGYNLRGACTDCYLDVSKNSGADGQNIQLWEPNQTGAQLFSIKKVDVGNIGVLTPAERKPVNLGASFYAYIVNTGLRKYVTNDTNGNISSRSQYDVSTSDIQRQIWHFTRLSNGAYKISSAYNNYCLDVQEFGRFNGTNARAYLDNGCSAQQWYLYSAKGGYNLRGACTDCYLDVADNSGAEGHNIQLWEPNQTGAQLFQIITVPAR